VYDSYGFRERHVIGMRLLEFCNAVEVSVANFWLKGVANQFVTGVSGRITSIIDYLLGLPET